MEWLAEGLDYLRSKFAPTITEVDGQQFSNKAFTEIKPAPDSLHGHFDVTTLTALRDLINIDAENLSESEIPLIHIVNHQEVQLLSGVSDEHGRRQVFAKAKPVAYTAFQFNTFHSLDNFRIGVQSLFVPIADHDYLVQMASKVIDGTIATSEDDGISQEVTVNSGLSLKAVEKLRSRVTLAPFRTFPEVDQPQSEFIFRAQKSNAGPQLGLFEADGGRWKVAAIENIALRLRELDIKLPIIA